jgi:hypothetical protein
MNFFFSNGKKYFLLNTKEEGKNEEKGSDFIKICKSSLKQKIEEKLGESLCC